VEEVAPIPVMEVEEVAPILVIQEEEVEDLIIDRSLTYSLQCNISSSSR